MPACPGTPGLHVFAPAEAAVRRDPDGAEIRIAGGPTIRARLVIGAEGGRARCARRPASA
jgi:2-polyprenyl-6-methoxyphenol hydroxylase-like FAD-dependent oxidoreductase